MKFLTKKERVVVNTLLKKPYHKKISSDTSTYATKKQNVINFRNSLDELFLNHGCGILNNNNEIIINDNYKEEDGVNYYDSPSKFVNSGLSVLGVKRLVMLGDFIFHCGGCNEDMVYTEYKGRKNFNFKVRDDLTVSTGYCNGCNNKRMINRKKNDLLFKVRCSLSSRTSIAFKSKTYRKTSGIKELIGCKMSYAKKHIEKQFTKGMYWKNYGEWHIDHIIPLCSANTEEELRLLCHYTNLQPLWAFDNISKNGKYCEKEKAKMLKFVKNCKRNVF